MAYKTKEFPTIQALEDFINGVVTGGTDLRKMLQGGKIFGLHGLTLVIGVETTTFADATGVGLSLSAIKAQIEAATTNILVGFRDGHIKLENTTPGNVSLKSTGTSNPIFGFPDDVDVDGTRYAAPDGTAPRIINVGTGARMDSYFIIVELA